MHSNALFRSNPSGERSSCTLLTKDRLRCWTGPNDNFSKASGLQGPARLKAPTWACLSQARAFQNLKLGPGIGLGLSSGSGRGLNAEYRDIKFIIMQTNTGTMLSSTTTTSWFPQPTTRTTNDAHQHTTSTVGVVCPRLLTTTNACGCGWRHLSLASDAAADGAQMFVIASRP